ncbi:MAG TPA: enoyl-CoA hydratase/isomerase family protein [Vicinamibacteria bacterium]|nr:enoyl-CoA hydratase/isomerase family protein [Vicinamibacteria bacterium]
MDFEHVSYASDGAVARLVLKRPPLNILDLPMIGEVNRALTEAATEPALRVLVISAEGKAFCAGVSVEDHLPPKARPMIVAFHEIFRRLRALPCATISVVQGAALGGGCELACFADLVVAADTASLGVPEIKLGVFPPIAVVHFPDRIGWTRTLQLITTGEVLAAAEAHQLGLVDRVVPQGNLAAAVEAAAGKFKEKSAAAIRLTRRAAMVAGGDFEARLTEVENLFLDELMETEDAIEGLKAFMEKRAPAWRHQ